MARTELRIATDLADAAEPRQSRPKARRGTLLVRFFAWLHFALLCFAWLWLWGVADRHWTGTLLAFGPRWGLLIPLPVLGLLALVSDRHLFLPTGLALLIGAGPLTGLCLPFPLRLVPGLDPPIRIMTLNTDGRADPVDVVAMAESAHVDVVCLQEVYRPERWVQQFGSEWEIRSHDEFLIASRHPIEALEPLALSSAPWDCHAVRCLLSTPLGRLNVVNLHTHSLRSGLDSILHRDPQGIAVLEKYTQRRNDEARQIVEWNRNLDSPLILVGDFNMAPGTRAYSEQWGRYLNAYSEAGFGWGHTFFSRWHGVRIDHVLTSRDYQALQCWVERDVGSAHRPVIASLQRVR